MRIRLALATAALLAACGGAQTAGEPEVCSLLDPMMTTAALNRQAACWADDTQELDGSDACRLVQERAGELNRAAARGLGLCVLRSGERADGAWIAEAMHAAADAPEAMLGLLDAFALLFDPSTHRNSFTAALTQRAQESIGAQLGSLDSDVRTVFVDLAFAFGLDPLRDAARPWVRELPADSAGLAAFASDAATTSNGPLDDTAQWALAASGTWSGADIVRCRAESCGESTEGTLALLEYAEPTMAPNPGPNQLLRMIHSNGMRAEEAEYAARWITHTEYEQREMMTGSLFAIFFNPENDIGLRRGLARGMGGGPVCNHPGFLSAIYAHWANHRGDRADADHPWSVLVRGCTPVWNLDSVISTLATEPYLSVDEATEQGLHERATSLAGDTSCEDAQAVARRAAEAVGRHFDAGRLAWVAAARAFPSCSSALASEIQTTARDSDSHPVARLRAIEWMVDQGDSSACGQISNAMRYRHTEYNAGPGPIADALAQGLRGRCR